MRDIARWMRRSLVTTFVAQNGQGLGGGFADAAPHERQVLRITRLFDEVLGVSRTRNGNLHLQPERIELRAVLRSAVDTVGPEVSARRQQLAVALPRSPVWLQADPGRLEQVFVSLLANASRYAGAEGELAVYAHVRSDQVVVRFRDSGIGIASDALPHVFDPFTQADAAAPCSREGRDIGLSLVRTLVALHGGRVTAGSAGLGKGSEFTVRLPLAA